MTFLKTLPLLLAFGFAYTQSPSYFSNQHQYLLHGLAAAGLGNLDEDWLAETADPTPLFSAMVDHAYGALGNPALHALFFMLLMVYCGCCLALSRWLTGEQSITGAPTIVFAAALIVIHSGIVRVASVHWLAIDYPWYLQSGVAGQYLLGPALQPSVFGILLLLSVVLYLHDRFALAVVCLAASCWFHATYLLPAGLLTLGFVADRWRSVGLASAIRFGIGALLAVTPVLAYILFLLSPTNATLYAESIRLLAEVRIPHHCQVERWLDWVAIAQVAWIGLALLFIRRTRLFRILLIPLVAGILLTLLQWATHNHFLALAFPWRVSVLLVPIASVVILHRIVQAGTRMGQWLPISKPVTAAISIVAILGVCIGGWFIYRDHLGYATNPNEESMLNFVRETRTRREVYLIPVRIPEGASGPKGSVSTTFTAPPGGAEKHLIAVDLQGFRLFTGAPIYVDFKSVPYKDFDVVEWYSRLQKARQWFELPNWGIRQAKSMYAAGITHAVLPAGRINLSNDFVVIYSDEFYQVVRIR